jgi:hypothetical protein
MEASLDATDGRRNFACAVVGSIVTPAPSFMDGAATTKYPSYAGLKPTGWWICQKRVFPGPTNDPFVTAIVISRFTRPKQNTSLCGLVKGLSY